MPDFLRPTFFFKKKRSLDLGLAEFIRGSGPVQKRRTVVRFAESDACAPIRPILTSPETPVKAEPVNADLDIPSSENTKSNEPMSNVHVEHTLTADPPKLPIQNHIREGSGSPARYPERCAEVNMDLKTFDRDVGEESTDCDSDSERRGQLVKPDARTDPFDRHKWIINSADSSGDKEYCLEGKSRKMPPDTKKPPDSSKLVVDMSSDGKRKSTMHALDPCMRKYFASLQVTYHLDAGGGEEEGAGQQGLAICG